MSMAARRQETAVVLPTLWFPVIAGPCGHTTLTSSTLTRTDSRRYGRVIQSQKGRSTTAEKRHGECDFFSADPSALRRMFCAVNAVSHQHPGTSRATGLEASQGNGQTAAQQAVQADWHACPVTPSTETMRFSASHWKVCVPVPVPFCVRSPRAACVDCHKWQRARRMWGLPAQGFTY